MVSAQIINCAIAILFGLVIGSFLNVVVARLPRMLEANWQRELLFASQGEQRGLPGEEVGGNNSMQEGGEPVFNLMVPPSSCPKCGHRIAWVENIPVLSYLFLGGKCKSCRAVISIRYPLVEVATGFIFLLCVIAWGFSIEAACWAGFGSMLLTLGLIDYDTTLLPDVLTLPLMWAGLIAAQLHFIGTLPDSSLWGAVIGYLVLWSVYWIFKLISGKEGMGHGDFKLLAAIGAWLGWSYILPVILLSSLVGAVVGIGLKLFGRLAAGAYMPFGPYLASAAVLVLWFVQMDWVPASLILHF